VKQNTTAGALLGSLLLLGLGVAPAYGAVAGASSTSTTQTVTTSTSTVYNDIRRKVDIYNTRVLGLATWIGDTHGEGYRNREVYNRAFGLPASAQEVKQAHEAAENAIQQDLDSTGGRGQVHFKTKTHVNHNHTENTKETVTGFTETVTVTSTIGPGTILIGDLDSGGTPFEVLAGTQNIDEHYHTQFNVDRIKTQTKVTNTLLEVTGELNSSPIVLDLVGSGSIQASGGNWKPHANFHSKHRALFDFFGNGFPVAMEWVGPTDGLLVKPKADGSVDGTCLFGTATGYTHGYEHLASLDSNLDGRLTGKELSGLSVWQDQNGNARCEKGELKTVQQLGISDFDLKHTDFKSTYTINGKKQAMFDWWPTMFEVKKIKQPV
jgi:hypothetical protein